MESSKTVGRFTLDPDGTITGPADYIRSESFARCKARMEAGEDTCGAFRFSPDVQTAILVTFQTDYAGWHGSRMFHQMRERAAGAR